MKKNIFALLVMMISLAAQAQNIGKWQGNLDVNGVKLPLVVRIANENKAWMDSPKQMAMNIVCDTLCVNGNQVSVGVKRMGILISGTIDAEGNLKGKFTQGMAQLPIEMKYVSKNPYLERPQTPQPPYPYIQKEVSFSHDDITLTGTLTMPESKKNLTAVVLVSGSGQQNRDEEMFGHRPFLVLADYLTRHGIAVLRYDDRGTGGSSKCKADATTNDFASDALAAVKYLRTVDEIKKVGIIGHSEGGQIAIMLAANNPKYVDFVVSMAAPTVKGKDLLLRQNIDFAKSKGATMNDEQIEKLRKVFDIIDTTEDVDIMKNKIYQIMSNGQKPEDMPNINSQIMVMTTPWYVNFVRFSVKDHLKKMRQPMLALYGNNDVQVNADENTASLKASYGGKKLTIKDYPSLNHLFQECKEPTADYGNIEQTMSPQMMGDVLEWLLKR